MFNEVLDGITREKLSHLTVVEIMIWFNTGEFPQETPECDFCRLHQEMELAEIRQQALKLVQGAL